MITSRSAPGYVELTGSNVPDAQAVKTRQVYLSSVILPFRTTTTILAGATLSFTATDALKGCSMVSVSLIESTQSMDIKIKSRSALGVGYFYDNVALNQAATGASTEKKFPLQMSGPLPSFDVQVEIKNVAAVDGTIGGLYVIGR